jgi:hypothetical protein
MVATLIAAGANYLVTAFGVSFTAATFAVSFALSQVVSRIFAENPESQQDMGVRQQVPPSQVNAIPIVYGDAYMGGTFVDAVLTTDQKTMYYVLAISSISQANATLGTNAGTFNFDMSEMYYGDRLISFASSGTVQAASIFNGGTGYSVSDVLTVSGGLNITAATVTVTSVGSGGVITGISISNAGNYTVAPQNPALVTGGTGTSASFVFKYSSSLNIVNGLADSAGNIDNKITNNLEISLYKSTNAGVITSVNGASAPSTVMGGSDIAVGQRWPATNRQMNNLAFAIVKLVYNRDADTTQLNPITFKVSHYPNGASVAKAGDVWLDYITNESYGGAVDPAFVDTTCVATLNAYSDATITYTPSGGGAPVTQARYRINGVLDAGQTVLSNLDRIMSACDSWMTYNAALGQWSVVVNKAETAAYAFTDNNIIGDIRVSATDITSSINQVEARFPFKENRDQAAFVNLETPVGLLYPNEPVNKYSITYDLVNDSVQAQYLANRLLEQAREDLIVSFSTTYYGIQVDAGNVVSVTNADYGWNAKLFRVMKVNEASLPDGSLGAKLELNEYSAGVYDDASITQYAPVANSNLASPAYFSALSAPTVTSSTPSASVPSFDVTVTVPTTGRVTFGTLYYTTTPSTPTSYLVLDVANSANNIPVVNGSTYTFANLTLPTGTYYFVFTVGNETATSRSSPTSSAFVWTPVGVAGPAGPAGPTGATGASGLAAITAYRSQSQTSAAPATPANTIGATAPAGWSLTAPSVVVGNVLWYTFGQYNSSSGTVSGIPAGETQWGTPTAASIFQDIRSDNWNGSNPPTGGNPATYGTAGYYIQQSSGNMFLNSVYARGIATFDGSNSVGGYTFALVANGSLNTNGGIIAYSSTIFNGAVMGYGSSGAFGGYFQTTGSQAALASFSSGSGAGLQVGGGTMTINNSTQVTNLNANYLQGYTASSFMLSGSTASDSNALGGVTASSWARIFPTNSGVANAGGSGVNLLGSTSTGIAGAYVGTSGTSNIVTWTVQTTSPSDIRLKEEIANADLGLDFVKQLRPVSYKLKADPKHQKGYGFIAQEVEALIGDESSLVYHEPDWKVGDETGFKTIHYPSYIAVLTKAIQELTAKVEALETKLKG